MRDSDAVDARFDAVDARFDAVDARFDEVTVSLVEQREYTEFAVDRLRGEMTAGFATVNANLGRLERKLDWLVDSAGETSLIGRLGAQQAARKAKGGRRRAAHGQVI